MGAWCSMILEKWSWAVSLNRLEDWMVLPRYCQPHLPHCKPNICLTLLHLPSTWRVFRRGSNPLAGRKITCTTGIMITLGVTRAIVAMGTSWSKENRCNERLRYLLCITAPLRLEILL